MQKVGFDQHILLKLISNAVCVNLVLLTNLHLCNLCIDYRLIQFNKSNGLIASFMI